MSAEVVEQDPVLFQTQGTNSCDDFEWEDLTDLLTELMDNVNPKGLPWRVEVSGFGWRGLDGEATFYANNGRELLGKVLPNTHCTFKIYQYADRIELNNAHHDKPCGGEWYTIQPCTGEDEE